MTYYTLTATHKHGNVARFRLILGHWFTLDELRRTDPGAIIIQHGKLSDEESLFIMLSDKLKVYENQENSWFGLVPYQVKNGYKWTTEKDRSNTSILGYIHRTDKYTWSGELCVK